MKSLGALVVFTLAISYGCSPTRGVESLSNPMAFAAGYSRVLVAFPAGDPELRIAVEDEFAEGVWAQEIFVPAHEVLDPEKEHRNDEALEVLAARGIDAVLLITPSGTEEVSAESATRTPRPDGRCASEELDLGCALAIWIYAYGYADRPWAEFVSTLYDVEGGTVVWRATTERVGEPWTAGADLLRSMARRTRAKLVEDGMLSGGS